MTTFWKPGSDIPPAAEQKKSNRSLNYRQRRQDHLQRQRQNSQPESGVQHGPRSANSAQTSADQLFSTTSAPSGVPSSTQGKTMGLSSGTLGLKFMQKKVLQRKRLKEREEARKRSRQEKWAAAEAVSTDLQGESGATVLCVPDDTVGCEADYSTNAIANGGRRSFGLFNPVVEERAFAMEGNGDHEVTDEVMANRFTKFIGLRGSQVCVLVS